MKRILIIAFIAVLCIAKLVQIQFEDANKLNPNTMYEITLTKNGVTK